MNTWFKKHSEDVLHEQNVELDKGLSESEAAARLKRVGANQLESAKKINPLTLFLGQFKDVLVIILLVAAVVSWGVGLVGETETAEIPLQCSEGTNAVYDADCLEYYD